MKPRHYADPKARANALSKRVKSRPAHKRVKKKKRPNPAFRPEGFTSLFPPGQLEDLLGMMLIPVLLRNMGIRGRDILSAAGAVCAPKDEPNQPLGTETPPPTTQPQESSTESSTGIDQAGSKKEEPDDL